MKLIYDWAKENEIGNSMVALLYMPLYGAIMKDYEGHNLELNGITNNPFNRAKGGDQKENMIMLKFEYLPEYTNQLPDNQPNLDEFMERADIFNNHAIMDNSGELTFLFTLEY